MPLSMMVSQYGSLVQKIALALMAAAAAYLMYLIHSGIASAKNVQLYAIGVAMIASVVALAVVQWYTSDSVAHAMNILTDGMGA